MPTNTFTAECDFCPNGVEFRWEIDGPFRHSVASVPGSGSDYLATWCAECGPQHRRAD